MKLVILAIVAALAVTAPVAELAAKPLSRMLADSGLTPEDTELMRQATGQLVVNGVPQVGKQAAWDNPQSGSSGTVTLQRMQGDCGYLEHQTHPQGREQALTIRTRLCQNADGQWLLAP